MTYDPSMSNFDFDYERGRQGELWAGDIRRAIMSDAVEVKTDAKFVHTGNFYIEYACRGQDGVWRDSGIAVTKATWWVIRWGKHDAGFFVRVELLKQACRNAGGRTKEMNYGQNPTKGVLVRVQDIVDGRDKSLDEHPTII